MKVAFKIILDGEKLPNGVFDINMEDFQRKACLLVGDHMTHTPNIIIYSSVVTRVIMCIALTMAVLHDLKFKATDVLNASLMAPNREKIWSNRSRVWG